MKSTYIHETHTIYAADGELHLVNDDNEIIFNMQTLFNDLPAIVHYCLQDQENTKKRIMQEICELIK